MAGLHAPAGQPLASPAAGPATAATLAVPTSYGMTAANAVRRRLQMPPDLRPLNLPDRRSPPTIGVVIPCYQSAHFVRAAVTAVLSQTRPPQHVVVIDDGSTDDPAAAVHDLLRADCDSLIRQDNGGVATARQAGVSKLAHTDYVIFLDADDVPEPTMFAQLAGLLDVQADAAVSWCLPAFIDEQGEPRPDEQFAPRLAPRGLVGLRTVPLSEPRTSFASIFALAGLVPSLALIRRASFDAAGGWDQDFGQGYEDTDLFLRLALTGAVLLCPQRLLRKRCHDQQSTSRADHHWRQEQRLRAKWSDLDGLDATQSRMVLEGWRLYNRQIALRRGWALARARWRDGRYWPAACALLGAGRVMARSCFVHHPFVRRA